MASYFPVSTLPQRLQAELRNARKRAGLTQKQVAAAMDWSVSKMRRIETGIVGISVIDLRALLACYKVNDEPLATELMPWSGPSAPPSTPDHGGEH